MRPEDIDGVYERENSPTAEFMQIQTQVGRPEIWLDFYIDDEEENTHDNGNSLLVDIDDFAKITFEDTYENFYQLREIVWENSLMVRCATLRSRFPKLASS